MASVDKGDGRHFTNNKHVIPIFFHDGKKKKYFTYIELFFSEKEIKLISS